MLASNIDIIYMGVFKYFLWIIFHFHFHVFLELEKHLSAVEQKFIKWKNIYISSFISGSKLPLISIICGNWFLIITSLCLSGLSKSLQLYSSYYIRILKMNSLPTIRKPKLFHDQPHPFCILQHVSSLPHHVCVSVFHPHRLIPAHIKRKKWGWGRLLFPLLLFPLTLSSCHVLSLSFPTFWEVFSVVECCTC